MNDERHIDVSVLMLGIDAAARARVQDAMRAIAERGDTKSPAGLVVMLREAAGVLRSVSVDWTHAGAKNEAPMPAREAQARFVAATHDARSRFEHELIRNFAGVTSREPAPSIEPRPGIEGVVVVTLVVAARVELADIARVHDRAEVERALAALAALDPADFVAMEVIWSPADPRERVSASEIEQRYPELVPLGPPGS